MGGTEQPRDGEDDPTGVQSLLSGLPDPQLRRDDLVARISASLADEERTRGEGDEDVHSFDPSLRRPRQTTWRPYVALALAGAAVGAVGLGALIVLGLDDSADVVADITNTRGKSAVSPLPSPAPPTQGQPVSAGEGAAHDDHVVLASGMAYTEAGLLSQAAPVDTVAGSPDVALPSSPLRAWSGVVDCLRAVGVAPVPPVHVDLATYDGAPAAVVVTGQGPQARVTVVERDCDAQSSSTLFGPAPLH